VDNSKTPPDKSRRRFLWGLGGVCLAWLAAALYPIYRYLSPRPAPDPFGKDGRALVEGITAADVARPNMGKNGGYGGRGLIVFRDPQGTLKAFDSKCTHAGCNVTYQVSRIHCNCHGGTYDLNGKNIAGPPPRPLTELGVVEKDGQLYVFRLKVAARSEAQS
jgi:Rieske Fe-S protein